MSDNPGHTENRIDIEIMNEISGLSLETINEKLNKDSNNLSLDGNVVQILIKLSIIHL